MTQREKLIKLLDTNCGYVEEVKADVLADRLLENDVIVLPCKIGSILELRMGDKTRRYRFQGVRQQFANSKPELFGVQLFGERLGVSIANVDSLGKTVFIVEEPELPRKEQRQ